MTGLLGTDKLHATERYCATCDPFATRSAACAPGVCQSCGHELIVLTQYSGKHKDRGQYAGPGDKYKSPVAVTTGNASHIELWADAGLPAPSGIPDDDIPF